MKSTIRVAAVLFTFAFSVTVTAETYFVSTGGSDMNPGSLEMPWATWQKAFNTARAGDTVYFRGGVYYVTEAPIINVSSGHGNSGTYNNWIVYANYPGETPILDNINHTNMTGNDIGLGVSFASYIKFIGLTVRNCQQKVLNQSITGVSFYECGNLHIERFTSHGHGGYGFRTLGYDTLYLINSDVYDCLDDNDTDPGNTADGFAISSGGEATDFTEIYGCRSWNNADDAFEINPSQTLYFHHNWAFGNGRENGSGKGVRFGNAYIEYYDARKCYNNLITFNNGAAFSHSHAQTEEFGYVMQFYNNTSYNNNYVGYMEAESSWDCETDEGRVKYANNISYNDYFVQAYYRACAAQPDRFPYYIKTTHNTWTTRVDQMPFTKTNDTITVTDDDFVVLLDSLDAIALLSSPRKPDGSLPDLNGFLELSSTSDLIDAGLDVGLPYLGNAPYIGYAEHSTDANEYSEPVFVSAEIMNDRPSILEITFNLALANKIPSVTSFSVYINSSSRNLNSASISGNKVFLTLTNPIAFGDVVTIAYTKPNTDPLQSIVGIKAESFPAQSVKNNCSPPVTNEPPSVNISSPTKITYYNAPATIPIEAEVYDRDGSIYKVEFFNGNYKLGERFSPPFSYIWKDVPEGNYYLTAIATDNSYASTKSDAINVVVQKSTVVSNQIPSATIISPINGSKFNINEEIGFTITASDPDGSIASIKIMNGNSVLAELTVPPFSYTWISPDTGIVVISAIAEDNLGATSFSSPIEFYVTDVSADEMADIELYPNPNEGHFIVSFPTSHNDTKNTIAIVNSIGEIVFKGNLPGNVSIKEFDLPFIYAGTYLFTVLRNNKVHAVKKFIKR